MEELIQEIHFSSMKWAVIAPLILMILDVITGYYNAWRSKKVSSSKMRNGLGKKLAEIAYVVVGILLKYAIGADAVMYFVIIYVCYMEIVSLAENCDKLGFPMPQKLRDKLNNK